MRLGILGGTFDPVHNGHLAMARAALRAAALDRVLMMPCARPPHKDRADLTCGYQRFAMLALALNEEQAIVASPAELERGGVSYTIETLRAIASENPRQEIFLVLGGDSFVELETWRACEEILEMARLLVAPREGLNGAEILDRAPRRLAGAVLPPGSLAASAPARPPLAALMEMDPVDVSSTEVRSRFRAGRPVTGLVPVAVEIYVRRQGIYGTTLIA